jgi:hypothetical protein
LMRGTSRYLLFLVFWTGEGVWGRECILKGCVGGYVLLLSEVMIGNVGTTVGRTVAVGLMR